MNKSEFLKIEEHILTKAHRPKFLIHVVWKIF